MQEIEDKLNSVIDGGSPSIQYMVFDSSEILYSKSFGMAKIEENMVAAPNTTYNIYSITKTITALGIMKLVQQGLMDIDSSALKYDKEFPYGGDITVRDLLSHSAGIPGPIPLSWIHLKSDHAQFQRDSFFSEIINDNSKLEFEPGKKYSYSNVGYYLLGRIIEVVSGMKYENCITQSIIDEIGLKKNEFGFEISSDDHHARGYHKKWSISNLFLGFFFDKTKYFGATENGWKGLKYTYVNGPSYGGLISSPAALAKYGQIYLRKDGVSGEDLTREIFTQNVLKTGVKTDMCLSWFKGIMGNHTYYTHAGGGGGYYSEIRIYPELKQGSLVVFNRTGMTDKRYLDELDELTFKWLSR